MKELLILSFVFMFSGCGKAGFLNVLGCFSFHTGGLNVCIDDNVSPEVDPYQIERHVQAVEEVAKYFYPDKIVPPSFEKRLNNHETILVITRDVLVQDCEYVAYNTYSCDERIGGFNANGGTLIYVEQSTCMAAGALAHELLHGIEYFYLGGATNDHTTENMFMSHAYNNGEPIFNTAEWHVKNMMYQEFCR